jgi:xylulokinase
MSQFLGLDSSTQSLSAMVIDTDSGSVVVDETVNFGSDLSAYASPQGFLEHPDPLVKHSDPLMWVAALDLLLTRLREAGVAFDRIAGVSGSGQQHGSVYLNAQFAGALDWHTDALLAEQVAPCLSRATSPIWMDSSTSAECATITEAAGGTQYLVATSGSAAIERFTGPQIRKFAVTEPEAYGATARIHLVSSFMASVLCGADVAVDHGDGAGMNLMALASGDWDQTLLDATAADLAAKLPATTAGAAVVGTVARYFCERYGFRPDTPVVAWSGDNPNSLVGMGAIAPGTAVISLGTSDTFFGAMGEPVTDPNGCGHVFGNPAGGFMSLICFKNGSLAREAVADRFSLSWDAFSDAILNATAT